jgi:hypothetical protein
MRIAPSPFVALALLAGPLFFSGCAAPQKTAASHGTQYLDSDIQVRRAQSPNGGDLFPQQTALNIPPQSAALNDSARFLAGMPAVGGRDAFSDLRATADWQQHHQKMESVWASFLAQHGNSVNAWAAGEIPDLRSANAVFYPFSGPDFLFAHVFFPKADTYVLCGLEPCEPIPTWNTLTPEDVSRGLNGLETSLSSILHYSYFITKDMRQDLQATRFRGVLPVFMVFLARTGNVVDSVDAVRLDGNGNAVVFAAGQSTVPGLLIRVHGPQGAKRIFYFSQDLSDGGLSANGPFLRFASSFGRPAVLLKSASYLMHEGYFSRIRNQVLTHSCGIVQDPSGVPLRYLRQNGMRLTFYGRYSHALDIFKQYEQPDLAAAYADPANKVKPLPFGMGYLTGANSTALIVARPK